MSQLETAAAIEHENVRTALVPRGRDHRTTITTLPPDLLAQSARRLRIVAILYAFVFFTSDPLTAILLPDERSAFFGSVLEWGPSTFSIATALIVAAMTWQRRVTIGSVLLVGLIFEVVGSYGIAAAQYLDVDRYAIGAPWAGLSWVAVWMLGFTVIVPTPPRWALVAALCSASAVPVVSGAVIAADAAYEISAMRFVFQVAVPYLLVVLIAYVGARVIYGLGAELTRARELGSYCLVERLGVGGMGEVWRAQHRLLARPAAVKLMRPEVLGASSAGRRAELHARFAREAQATSSLRSPHTIQLYDFGVADDGAFYYAMELLDGFDLQTLVERFGPVPPERAIFLLSQVCDSLAEAHAQGLIHRDVKPANVYVCWYGREVDFVKVLDFGLVKSQNAGRGIDLTITRDQVAGGTPAFMSPEQVRGDTPLDPRSDIYAVGCLAYWLVTGRLVFTGRTAMEIIVQHAGADPVPPSEISEIEIPDALDRLILGCLQKNPADRPASADIVAERLLAIETKARWTRERARQWWDVHALANPPADDRQLGVA